MARRDPFGFTGELIDTQLRVGESMPVTLVGWYWHFVDVVWIVVFLVVYVAGR